MAPADGKQRILIVDDDAASVDPLRERLSNAGFSVHSLANRAAAMIAAVEWRPDLVIIDWNLKDLDAEDLILSVRRVRAPHPVRLIILSSLSDEQDVIKGLNLGADDYIKKPFSLREAVARVSALLRPSPQRQAQELACDELVLETSVNRATARGKVVHLRAVEYRLLEFLMSHPGRAFTRSQLLTQVWGGENDVSERTVDVNVQRLRKMLSGPGYETYIQTVRGFGYCFSSPSPSPSPAKL